jgi:hypothetical protein
MRDKRFKNLYYYNTYDFLENRRLGLLPDCSPGAAPDSELGRFAACPPLRSFKGGTHRLPGAVRDMQAVA